MTKNPSLVKRVELLQIRKLTVAEVAVTTQFAVRRFLVFADCPSDNGAVAISFAASDDLCGSSIGQNLPVQSAVMVISAA